MIGYVSNGILKLNQFINLKINNTECKFDDLNSIQQLKSFYESFETTPIRTYTSTFVNTRIRKSKSQDFSTLFNLNTIIESLKLNCKSGFFNSRKTYELIPDKVFIYASGDSFEKQRDFELEKLENGKKYVGTLLIFANTDLDGGDLIVYKNDKLLPLKCSKIQSDYNNLYNYVLFSLDVEHEVHYVDSGYRCYLKFKIIEHPLPIVDICEIEDEWRSAFGMTDILKYSKLSNYQKPTYFNF